MQEWTDANMRWNTSEYSDIKDIRIPPAQLWKPDILMYNRSVLLHILYVGYPDYSDRIPLFDVCVRIYHNYY